MPSLPAAALDELVMRIRPSLVLELGMHCGYSSVRLLRLLPPASKLITVEMDPLTAELGEEIILVAGFKHSQVLPGELSYFSRIQIIEKRGKLTTLEGF